MSVIEHEVREPILASQLNVVVARERVGDLENPGGGTLGELIDHLTARVAVSAAGAGAGARVVA